MKRFKFNWAIPGLLAMILIIAGVAWAQSQASVSPDPAKLATQCAECHQMGDHVTTWQESSHKSVACTDCHADPGVRGWVEMQVGKVRMYTHKGNSAELSQIATDVPNSRCIECHARQMPWVMQDLKPAKLDDNGAPLRPAKDQLQFLGATAGHDVHLTMDNPLSCTDCHKAVSHGPAPEKQADRAEVMHQICLDCHAQQNVAIDVRNTVSCSACHLELDNVKPADHETATFRKEHGKNAQTNVATCQQCHLNPGLLNGQTAAHGITSNLVTASDAKKSTPIPQLPAGSLKVPEGVQLGDECAACHGVTMPHPNDWLSSHSTGFKEKPELCASCHGTRDQGFNMTFKGDPRTLSTTDASCTSCHAQPMPHPENWFPTGHAEAAKLAPTTCAQCHSPANPANPKAAYASARFCQDCHLSKYAHPAGYVLTHKQVLARYGNSQGAAGCTQCHTATENSCSACHAGGVTGPQKWHPDNYVANHKDTLARYNGSQAAAGCTQCHLKPSSPSQAKAMNSCEACHTGGVSGQQQWHPADFVASHKDNLAQYNGDQAAAGCTQCHLTPSNPSQAKAVNACEACHTSGLGKTQQWHPEFWWIKHAQTTRPEDINSCQQCHAYVQPSCSQCHTKY